MSDIIEQFNNDEIEYIDYLREINNPSFDESIFYNLNFSIEEYLFFYFNLDIKEND